MGLRAVIEHAPVIVFSVDRAGIFTVCEGRGLQALGRQPGQSVGMSAFDLYRDYPHVIANLKRALAGETVNDVVRLGDPVFEILYVPATGRLR
jgi:PAS domain-containing protein